MWGGAEDMLSLPNQIKINSIFFTVDTVSYASSHLTKNKNKNDRNTVYTYYMICLYVVVGRIFMIEIIIVYSFF